MALVTRRSLFIHVQKTAGMAVREAMHSVPGGAWESGPVETERHIGLPELLVAHPGIATGRFVFGFVRHPVAWLHSRYHFARASGFEIQRKHRPSAAALWISSCWAPTFEQFIELYLERFPGIATQEMFRRLGLWSDRPANYVGRTEDMADDLIKALTLAGEVFDVEALREREPVNATPRDMREDLPKQLIVRILAAEQELVRRFYWD